MSKRTRLNAFIPLPNLAYIPGTDSAQSELFLKTLLSESPLEPLEVFPFANPVFNYGVDLFHHGFYWEAHVVFEEFWKLHPRQSEWGIGLQALIHVCAAGVKLSQDRIASSDRHLQRAKELICASTLRFNRHLFSQLYAEVSVKSIELHFSITSKME